MACAEAMATSGAASRRLISTACLMLRFSSQQKQKIEKSATYRSKARDFCRSDTYLPA